LKAWLCNAEKVGRSAAFQKASISAPKGSSAGSKEMTDFVKVAKADEINPGQARLVDVKGKQIAVFNINGDFFAIDNMCTHEEASLAEGEI
jgi:hypothetical protein